MVGQALTSRVTVPGVVKTCNGRVWHIHIEPSGLAGSVIVYDNPTTNAGTVLVSIVTPANSTVPIDVSFAPIGLKSRLGLYVVVADCVAVVHYS